MKSLILAFALISASAHAAVPAGGLSCKAHRASSQAKLKSIMMNRLIYSYFYNDHAGFKYDTKTGTLTLRTKRALSTFCVAANGELGTQVICAPWGEAARVLYRPAQKKATYGVALLQVLDERLSAAGDVFMDCQEF
jgi:hypothetical protein